MTRDTFKAKGTAPCSCSKQEPTDALSALADFLLSSAVISGESSSEERARSAAYYDASMKLREIIATPAAGAGDGEVARTIGMLCETMALLRYDGGLRDGDFANRIEQAVNLLRSQAAAAVLEVDDATRLFNAGWCAAADFADDDDLYADIGCSFYEKRLADVLDRCLKRRRN